jgi:V/A-type H+/Na+-transporting ATPase subunit E
MTLDTLIEEIRTRAQAEMAALQAAERAQAAKIADERDRAIAEIRATSARATDAEIARERVQRIAAAKLQARKRLYEAREQRLEGALRETRDLLASFTDRPDYPNVLKRMVQVANDELGRQIKVMGRTEDAARLQKAAGKSFDPTPQPILGGIVAESADGSRRLNLSFDELLRLREDRVRAILA